MCLNNPTCCAKKMHYLFLTKQVLQVLSSQPRYIIFFT